MTSAPRSASSRPPEGPATMWLSSRTRKPVSGRRPVPPVAAPSVICDIFLQVVTTSVRPVARWLTVALDERQAESLGSSLPLFGPGSYSSWESRWAIGPRSDSLIRRGLLILSTSPRRGAGHSFTAPVTGQRFPPDIPDAFYRTGGIVNSYLDDIVPAIQHFALSSITLYPIRVRAARTATITMTVNTYGHPCQGTNIAWQTNSISPRPRNNLNPDEHKRAGIPESEQYQEDKEHLMKAVRNSSVRWS